jgi:hypothetical protein
MRPRSTCRLAARRSLGGPALAVAAIAACNRPTATTTTTARPAPAPAAEAPRAAVDSPPVEPDLCHASVDWREGGFEIVGLPCVSRNGAEVLYARSDERPRYPDLTVVTVTRADKLSRDAVVMEPHESGELLDATRQPTPELRARIVKANVMLAEVSRRAVPLALFQATPAGTHVGQGIEIAWTERGRLTISRDGRFVHEGDYSRWLEQMTACAPPSYLEKVWGDAGRGVLLVRIAYRGSGGCTALPELHVISWSP